MPALIVFTYHLPRWRYSARLSSDLPSIVHEQRVQRFVLSMPEQFTDSPVHIEKQQEQTDRLFPDETRGLVITGGCHSLLTPGYPMSCCHFQCCSSHAHSAAQYLTCSWSMRTAHQHGHAVHVEQKQVPHNANFSIWAVRKKVCLSADLCAKQQLEHIVQSFGDVADVCLMLH